jgi:acyl dehydratase
VSYQFVSGARLPVHVARFDRRAVRDYCFASGDFSRIHYDEQFAGLAGFSNPLVHGMLLAAHSLRSVTDLVADPTQVIDIRFTFGRPVEVPPMPGFAEVVFSSFVASVDENGAASLRIRGLSAEAVVLRGVATVRSPAHSVTATIRPLAACHEPEGRS